MEIANTPIRDLKIITPKIFRDERGYFYENHNANNYKQIIGKDLKFVQDNISCSKKNILRGLHFQEKNSQGKLVSVVSGSVYDVAVDLREGSNTFLKTFGLELSSKNHKQLWIPPGFAHGFLSLADNTIVHYKCTDFYAPEFEKTIIWNDETLSINWLIQNPIISEKDALGLTCKELFYIRNE